ncbi:MAG: MBL fold metallo-hydrolase, partial [Gammaproteobacteria bacterium]|nr:MBL fold metallo-hydrolase [Gammaproteobacteria bacterium]
HMVNPAKLWQGALAVYGEQAMQSMYGEIIPVDEDRTLVVEDGSTLDLNGRSLLFIDTPGHARHHYSVFDDQTRGFFTGDTFGMAYQELSSSHLPYIMPTTTPVQFDPEAWYQTLQRYLEYKPERMFLTHYGMVEEVESLAADLQRRIECYVQIAESCRGSNNRTELMKSKIAESTFSELRKLNCPLPIPACKGLLAMDIELNVQGLEIWLDNKEGG